MSDQVYLYRVQDKKGRGPFKPGVTAKWIDEQWRPGRPSIFDDFSDHIGLIQSSPALYKGCACESTDQLRVWFSKCEYQRLVKMGYRAYKIGPVSRLLHSESQTVFTSDRSPRKIASPINFW